MPLKYKCKTKDEIPAEHLPLYAERVESVDAQVSEAPHLIESNAGGGATGNGSGGAGGGKLQ